MKVTVYYSPNDAKSGVIRKAVVVLTDVLRMTTTVATYLSHGANAVHLCQDPASAKTAFGRLKRGEGILAGEAHWEKVAGFPLGGSPLESTREKVKGKTVCFSTRSATALRLLADAEMLLLGAFANLSDVYDTLLRLRKDVVIVCGVSETGHSTEDAVFAGMLVDFLQNTVGADPVVLSESAKKAVFQYKPWQGRLLELLKESPEGQDLARKGHEKDLVFCSRTNRVDGVPVLRGGVFVRESAPKPRIRLSSAAKAEAAAPGRGKAIKVHVPLFPKNPEHPTPDLLPKKKPAIIGKQAVPERGKAPRPVKDKPVAKGSVPAKPAAKGSVPAKSAAKGSVPAKPAAKGSVPAKPSPKAVKEGAAKPAGTVPPRIPSPAKPLPRKTPLFSKRTVAAPMAASPAEPLSAVAHAVNALKASLAHLKFRDQSKSAGNGKGQSVPSKKKAVPAPKGKKR